MRYLDMKRSAIAILLMAFGLAGRIWAQDPPAPKADVIFTHGNIYTGVPGTSSFHEIQRAEAMAVKDGRVLAVGKTTDLM